MLQLQTAIEEERCKVLQVDGQLEEILETSSYFVDRSQDVLEVLTARMARMDNNEETPAELLNNDTDIVLETHQKLPKNASLTQFVEKFHGKKLVTNFQFFQTYQHKTLSYADTIDKTRLKTPKKRPPTNL